MTAPTHEDRSAEVRERGRTAYEARFIGLTLGPRGVSPAWDDLRAEARAVWAGVEAAVATAERIRAEVAEANLIALARMCREACGEIASQVDRAEEAEAGWCDATRIAVDHGKIIGPALTAMHSAFPGRIFSGDLDRGISEIVAERDRLAAEVAGLRAEKTTLLRVISHARAWAAFAAMDEAEGIADGRTRKARFGMICDDLDGVGDIEARRALGFLRIIDGDLARRALVTPPEGASDVQA